MVIVPKSLICVKDGDNSIEVSANAGIYGIHLQYKMIDECGNTTFNSAEASLQNSWNFRKVKRNAPAMLVWRIYSFEGMYVITFAVIPTKQKNSFANYGGAKQF